MKHIEYSFHAGGSTIMQGWDSLKELLDEIWKHWSVQPYFKERMNYFEAKKQIRSKSSGVLLIGVYDDAGHVHDSLLRRTPRGYTITWKEVEDE